MKKYLPTAFLFLLIASLLHCFFVKVVYAQRELQDYSYQYEKYRDFHDQYVEASNTYLKYQTLASRTELIKASRDFLHSRSIVLQTYFQVLNYLLKQAPDVIPGNKNYLILSLDNEYSWLNDYAKSVDDLQNPTFDDLLEISQRFERKKYDFNKITYQVLSNILLGEMRNLQSESGAINFLLADKIEKNGDDFDRATLNQWMETIRNMNYQTQANIQQAETYLEQLNSKDGSQSFGLYQNLQGELEKSRLGLINTLKYQREILKEVSDE